MEPNVSQAEADLLLRMEKFRVDSTHHAFPDLGGHIEIALQSQNQREYFLLNISRKKITLTTKYQMRGRKSLVLARLDFSAPHRNPTTVKLASHICICTARGLGTSGQSTFQKIC